MGEACILRSMLKHDSRFGAHLRKLRVQRGIGLRKLAMTVGISATYLSKVERGEMPPPAERQVLALARILGQDEDVFLGMAGRIASDLPAIIKKHPREYAGLLRALRNIRKQDFYVLFDTIGPDLGFDAIGPDGELIQFKRYEATPEEAARQFAEYKAMLARIDRKPLALSRTAVGDRTNPGAKGPVRGRKQRIL
jgi:HTH-type transcriptional regulator, competence development regulator